MGIVTASATEAAKPALTNFTKMVGSFCPGVPCILLTSLRKKLEANKWQIEQQKLM